MIGGLFPAVGDSRAVERDLSQRLAATKDGVNAGREIRRKAYRGNRLLGCLTTTPTIMLPRKGAAPSTP